MKMHLNSLTQKIQKAIPELMELREGCVIVGKRSRTTYTILEPRERPFYLCFDKNFFIAFQFFPSNWDF